MTTSPSPHPTHSGAQPSSPHRAHVLDEPGAGGARRGADVPWVVVAAAAAVLAVNVVVMVLGAIHGGIAWDEPTHVDRLSTWFATEWYLPRSQMSGDVPTAGTPGLYVYAPVAALVTHAVAALSGAEGWGTTSTTPDAYVARHLGVVLFALVGLGAAAAILRVLSRSWRWALVAAATLSAIPAWTGHAMFNIKDLPVATGYTLVTLGLVLLAMPGVRSGRQRVMAAIALAAGVVVALGTRPGIWAGLLASVVVFGALTVLVDRRSLDAVERRTRLVDRAVAVAAGVGGGYVVLLMVYPNLFAHPALLLDALRDSADYPWITSVLTNGSQMPMPPSWTYLPSWFGAQTPLLILAAAAVGSIGALLLLLGAVRGRSSPWHGSVAVALIVVGAQALVLPLGAMARQSVLYDGTRQVLFVVPALAVLAASGAWLVLRRTRVSGRRLVAAAAWVLVLVGLIAPTATHIRLFPYDYTYFNLAAESRGIDGRWSVDYWRTSGRAITPSVPAGDESCVVWRPGADLFPCGILPPLTPYWDTRGSATEQPPAGAGEYWFTMFNGDGTVLPAGCTEVSRVSRPLLMQTITMSLVARCAAPLRDYPTTGVRTAAGQAKGFLLWGWYPAQALGVWSRTPSAQVGFVLPSRLQGGAVRLTMAAAPYVPPGGSRTMTVTVNGTVVRAQTFVSGTESGRLVVDVPAAVAASLGGGRFIVALSVPSLTAPASVGDGKDARPLGVVLGSVTVESAEGNP